jgi:class 3 adenylate cyclase
MKKRILFTAFICALLYAQGTFAQTNLDSLFKIWNDQSAHDTARLIAIGEVAEKGYLFSQPDSAFYLYQEQYDFAEAKGLTKYMGKALGSQAFCFLIRSRYFQALDYYQKSLKIHTEMKDQFRIAGSMNGIAIIYTVLGDYTKSLEYYSRILELNDSLGNQTVAAGTTVNMAGCYYELGEMEKALTFSNRGIQMSEEIGNKRFLANGLDYRGKIYSAIGEVDNAKSDFQIAIKKYTELGDNNGIAECSVNFGSLYNRIKQHRKAASLCEKGLLMSEEIESVDIQKNACECLYDAYKALGNGDKALVYHEKLLFTQNALQKEDASKKLQQMEFQKEMLADSIAKAEEARLAEEAHQKEVRKGEKTRNILGGIGILVLILAGGLYGRMHYIRKSKAILQTEKNRSENLLLNILPAEIAQELKEKGKADARDFEMVSILFTDFKQFTETSEKLSAQELVAEINTCFEAFDKICENYKIEKIKTIGDSFMAAGGLPVPTNDSVKNTIHAALEMQEFISKRKKESDAQGKAAFEMRVGIHTGPVVAGIVGVKKFQYDIWGDTVNTASRIESSGEIGKVNISQSTYELLKDDPEIAFEIRGKIEAKGKGKIEMYFVSKT